MIYSRLGLDAIPRGKTLLFSGGIPQHGTNIQGKRRTSSGPFQRAALQRHCESDDKQANEESEKLKGAIHSRFCRSCIPQLR